MESLVGFTTGFGIPQYVLETDLGKIPASREVLHRTDTGEILVENYDKRTKNLGAVLR
jgi:lysine 2,3-aminomutase